MPRFCLYLRPLIAFSLLHSPVHAAKVKQSSELRLALKHSGGNRAELEVALRTIPGRDTEYLLTHASQYDLVNLTHITPVENQTIDERRYTQMLRLKVSIRVNSCPFAVKLIHLILTLFIMQTLVF